MITGLSFTILLDAFTCRPALRSFNSYGNVPFCTMITTSRLALSISSWLILRVISYVFVSSFFANRLNHCRNFSIQTNVRRRVFQLEHRNRRQFKEAVGLTVVTYTSFFTSRFSSVTFSNCFLASDPHFYARRMGLSASVLFSEIHASQGHD